MGERIEQNEPEPSPQQTAPPVGLERVLITAELASRPVRAPDFQAESQVLVELMRALKEADPNLLQKLADTALRLCRAHSAGVSIEEEEQGRRFFRWHGAAGRWSPFLREAVPRELSLCGTVVDTRAPLLMAYPERHYVYPPARVTPIAEMLIVPLEVAGAPVGTIWVIMHDDSSRFDREDLRLLTNLSEYASLAYQVLQRRVQVQEALARERLGSQLLHSISAGLVRDADASAHHEQILDAATTLMHADGATIRVAGPDGLNLLARKGVYTDNPNWQQLRVDHSGPCGRVLRTGQRYILPDIEQSEGINPAALETWRSMGVRALQSTPLATHSGELIGVLSTYWRKPYEPTTEELRLLDVLARLAADLMERAKTGQVLHEMDRRKNEFLAVLSHELRNPLAPITTGLELLGRADNKPEAVQAIHAMMSRQVSHLTRLVDDLLDLSRITLGTIELKRAPLELRGVLEAAIELAKPLVDQRHHRLMVEHATGPLPVDGDCERLTQVVSNVLSNAARYTDAGGTIHVQVTAERTDAVIRVRDTGLGIPVEKLEEVFEMFTQVPEHRAQSGGGGLGIGLALSRRLVELHGGSIRAASAGLGHGSEFLIRLPLAKGMDITGRDANPGNAGAYARRLVLIVEDNVDAAYALRVALESLGHTVEVAHDGPRGLSRFQELAPEVLLLDIGLPGMDGYEVARQVRSLPRGQRTLLIAVTGWGQQSDRERARTAGFDVHLTKPVSLGDLRAVMDTIPAMTPRMSPGS
jgi:signal transduction histidine kinase/ActR/RegA family two-component response regulator